MLCGFTKTINAQFNYIARLQVHRGFHAQANTRRCTCGNNITWNKRHKLAYIGNEVRDICLLYTSDAADE